MAGTYLRNLQQTVVEMGTVDEVEAAVFTAQIELFVDNLPSLT